MIKGAKQSEIEMALTEIAHALSIGAINACMNGELHIGGALSGAFEDLIKVSAQFKLPASTKEHLAWQREYTRNRYNGYMKTAMEKKEKGE